MQKQIKKNVLAKPQYIHVEAPPGLMEAALSETKQILSSPLQDYKFTPEISEDEGLIGLENMDYRQGMELCYRSLCARNIWLRIHSAHVGSFGEMQKAFDKISWAYYLPEGCLPQIEVRSFKSKLYHEGKIKEHLSDHLKSLGFKNSDEDLRIQLVQKSNRLEVFISLAGEDLYKRGFKSRLHTKAPLAEHLAAALLWDFADYDEVFVPFAGSGTLAFEALFQKHQIAPVNLGRDYGMDRFPASPETTAKFIRNGLAPKEFEPLAMSLLDFSEEQCEELRVNVVALEERLKCKMTVKVMKDDFFETKTDFLKDKKILLPLNPPYGIRLGQKQGSVHFYSRLGERLKELAEVCAAMEGFCLVPDEASYKALRQIIGEMYRKTAHINQGGRHIRALYFAAQK